MVLSWIAYALALTLLVGGAAAAAERWLRLSARPARWTWLAAMLLSVGVPAAYFASPALLGASLPTPDIVPTRWTPAVLAGPPTGSAAAGGGSPRFVEAWFPWVWAAVSGGVLAWLSASAWRIRRMCGGSPSERAGGHRLVWTSELGPGVIGLRHPRIVVPEWVRRLDAPLREMVLLHEREHVRGRDPVLLHAGWALVVLAPWLLPLWWQFRRLRLAVELDCDQRVVERLGDARAYGRLLVRAKRQSLRRPAPLVTGGGSFLRRRVRRLAEGTAPRSAALPRRALPAVACLVALSSAVLLPPPGSAATPASGGVATPPPEAARGSAVGEELWSRLDGSFDDPPRLVNRDEAEAIVREHHPDDLRRRGVGGEVLVIVHLDADGRVTGGFVSVSSGHPELDRAALEVASEMRWEPARIAGEAKAVWMGQPVRFTAP